MKDRVLVVEDDFAALKVVSLNLEREGFSVRAMEHPGGCLETALEWGPNTVLTDYAMPGMTGLELLGELQRELPLLPVVLMTGHGDERLAVQAMAAGAFNYLAKPLDFDELALICRRAAEMHRLRLEIERAHAHGTGHGLIGESASMRQLRRVISEVAPTDVTVLVRGETGTGKEVVARAIHDSSLREGGPFVAVNCSAIPEALLEAELFGHTRGAFTGADRTRRGRFHAANGGTLFLDEIGDLPAPLQPKLLRVLEERAVTPLGSDRSVSVDVRVVTATNQPLEDMVSRGDFRQDLFYRLNVVPIVIPPLRDRVEDIARLISSFTARIANHHGKSIQSIDPELVEYLKGQQWEGNVRELENVIERLVIFSNDGVLHIPEEGIESAILPPYHDEKERVLTSFEKPYLETALRLARGRLSEVCERTGLSARQLYNLMKKHELEKEEFFA